METEHRTATVRKTFKEKLKPTPTQACRLEDILGRCRTLYNTALEQRISLWRQRGVSLSRFQQEAELKDLRTDLPDYAGIHSHVLQDVLARLDKTYQAYFRRLTNGEKAGFPRFQGHNRYHSFTYKEYGNGARLDNGYLVLSKIGRIAVRWSRPVEGTIKTVTLSKEADGWYVCFSCIAVPTQPLPATGLETGIDVGLKVFLVTADGQRVANPRHFRKAEKELAKANKLVSRRRKGSKRHAKAVRWCAKKHQHVRRQRADFHHKTALALLRQCNVIYLEDLRVRNLVRNHHVAKSISDAAWRQFRTILEAKAVYAGRQVLAIPPNHTTQDCSNIRPDGTICGERIYKSLSVRTHICPKCGYVADRDENAARNIQWAGQALRGVAGMPAASNRESAGS